MKDLELYIHIPFCVKKCNYCDFLSAPAGEQERQSYVESLCGRIRAYAESIRAYRVISIFVGGGTPSILESGQIERIFGAVYDTFRVDADAEITMEMNPGTVTKEKLLVYRRLGVNRLSIGLQSAEHEELKKLGRIHTYGDFLASYQTARQAGFQNINIDLMSGIPCQTLESYERSLKLIAELEPEHISAYSLIIEEGTPFYERYRKGKHVDELPDEDTEREMYVCTKEILESYGYHRYEISNYAEPGFECRHNLGYWNRTEYLGIGTGASSFMNHQRWKEGEEPVTLTRQEEIEEFMFLGLRKMEGVSRADFHRIFGEEMESVYKNVIAKMKKQSLLDEKKNRLFLTERGIDVSNYVMSEFLF
ncbi:MAG: radical SAM family heme chaperone HemW [Dorea sp.]|nr:radical SAM family heme chaperone HemW [Dorea sp.]